MIRRLNPGQTSVLATLLVMGVIIAFGAIRYQDQHFLSLYNASSILQASTVVGIAAIGSLLVIVSGGIDLSVGAVIAFSSILMAVLVSGDPDIGPGWHPLVAAAFVLACGAGFGAFMGATIAFFRLPPFLVTLAGMFFARAMGFVVHPQSVGINSPFYNWVADHAIPLPGRVFLPLTVVLMLACYAVASLVMRYTGFGRDVYAVGGDETSAELMGVRTATVKIRVYAIASGLAALAGIVATFNRFAGNPADFMGYELDCIAAAVIGGAELTGGIGLVIGALFGTVILNLIRNVIDNEGTLSTWWTNIATGLLLFAFILLQRTFLRLSGGRHTRE